MKSKLALILLVVIFVLSGCGKSEVTNTVTYTEGNYETEINDLLTVKFEVVRSWKPDGKTNGLGLELVLSNNLNDITKEDMISFIRKIADKKDPATITVYASKAAYVDAKGNYGEEAQKGHILSYVKNNSGNGAFQGFNEIRWMQEKGRFENLFGETTTL